ncbi:MAG: ATP F0F1 synthase subunit I [Sphingomonas sp.]|nr:ATP F0F1 synthase subunit I [Sphingomonas sp.]
MFLSLPSRGGFFHIWIARTLSDDKNSDDLDRRIAEAKAAHEHGISNAEGRAESRGWAVGIEFVGTVLVTAFIGWMIDRWAGTGPWVMIALLILGFVAGVYRAMKTSAQFDADPATGNRE